MQDFSLMKMLSEVLLSLAPAEIGRCLSLFLAQTYVMIFRDNIFLTDYKIGLHMGSLVTWLYKCFQQGPIPNTSVHLFLVHSCVCL